ncbi:MAG: SiaB family protein kinase [Cytophagales bacterium]|nr:SiaB family protein kinase [Cytophagales bacterium]MDW8384829.1 SiaB family protein kinase [Flammeovirgaceae bacterium]
MELDIRFTKSILDFYEEMTRSGMSLVYFGDFSQQITKMFTSMAEDMMEINNESKSVQRKMYHAMVEILQNLQKHSEEFEDRNAGRGLFIIGKDEENYYIITCNKIAKEDVDALSLRINKINMATKEELKQMYMDQLKYGSLSSKNTAGLGLIDIARKTGQKYSFHFLPLDKKYSFFILKVQVSLLS